MLPPPLTEDQWFEKWTPDEVKQQRAEDRRRQAEFDAAHAQDQPTSLWELNESVLGLYKNGAERIFRYEEPRAAVQQEGVVSGTLWFKGTLTGNTSGGGAGAYYCALSKCVLRGNSASYGGGV